MPLATQKYPKFGPVTTPDAEDPRTTIAELRKHYEELEKMNPSGSGDTVAAKQWNCDIKNEYLRITHAVETAAKSTKDEVEEACAVVAGTINAFFAGPFMEFGYQRFPEGLAYGWSLNEQELLLATEAREIMVVGDLAQIPKAIESDLVLVYNDHGNRTLYQVTTTVGGLKTEEIWSVV